MRLFNVVVIMLFSTTIWSNTLSECIVNKWESIKVLSVEQIKDKETWKVSERKMELVFKETGVMVQSISGKVVKYVYKIIGDNVIIDNTSGVFKDGTEVSNPKYATVSCR